MGRSTERIERLIQEIEKPVDVSTLMKDFDINIQKDIRMLKRYSNFWLISVCLYPFMIYQTIMNQQYFGCFISIIIFLLSIYNLVYTIKMITRYGG
jgi:hypothetical protein